MSDAIEQDWSDLPMIGGGMPIPVPRGHPEYRAPKSVRYPKIEVQFTEQHLNSAVQLTGQELSAYVIITAVVQALKDAGVERNTISQFRDEALASDYDELLSTCSEWVTVS